MEFLMKHTLTPRRSTGWLLALALSSASLSLWAQPTPTPTQPGHAHEHRAHTMERMKAGHERHLQQLKGKLQLSAAQEPAWLAFAAVMAAPPALTHTPPDRAELARLSTPERIERMKTFRTQRQTEMNAQMDRRGETTKTFYSALTADQKKIFDEETARHMARRGEHGVHHGHRGHLGQG